METCNGVIQRHNGRRSVSVPQNLVYKNYLYNRIRISAVNYIYRYALISKSFIKFIVANINFLKI